MKIRVTFEMELPIDANRDEVREWVEFELRKTSSMKNSNPLCDTEIQANYVSISS